MSPILNHIICDNQHGFCKLKSIFTNLLSYQKCITDVFMSGFWIDAIFMHFSKVFETIDISNLHITKLEKIEVVDLCLAGYIPIIISVKKKFQNKSFDQTYWRFI